MPFSVADAVVSPGVFVETIIDLSAAGITGVPRVPFILAVGEEEQRVLDFQLHRGSSAIVDNYVFEEDLADQIALANRTFQLDNFPVVDGGGTGTVTDDPNSVEVLLNGRRISVAQLDGSLGTITLTTLPVSGDTLTVNYFYRRRDSLITDQDLSVQADGTNRIFAVSIKPIVRGDDSGFATTDTSKVTVTVDDVAVAVESVDGQNGTITLVSAPADGSTVLATYWTNKWQNTFDELPHEVSSVIRVGTVPGREDFINTTDYVVSGSRIYWGTFALLTDGFTAAATTPFDEDVISTTTIDNRVFLEESGTTPDGSGLIFQTSQVPVDGSGQGIAADRLGLGTPAQDRDDLVEAYVGPDPVTAFGAGRVLVTKIDATARNVYLETAPPAPTYSTGTITIGGTTFADTDGVEVDGQNFEVNRRATTDITIADDSTLDGKYLTITDGINTVTFEFDDDSVVTAGRVAVTIGATENDTATNLEAAIAASALDNDLGVTSSVLLAVVTVTTVTGRDVGTLVTLDAAITTEVTLGSVDNGYSATAPTIGFSEDDTAALTADRLVTAINAAGLDVSAAAVGAVITVTATRQSGDDITLSVLNGPNDFSVSGATLSGAVDSFVFFTYYQSLILDKAYTLEVTRAGDPIPPAIGPGDVGQYTITDADGNIAMQVTEETTLHSVADVNFPGNVATPGGVFDWQADLDNAIDETVTITFSSATAFAVSSSEVGGSTGTGFVGQTYVDAVTGLRFTLADPQVAANTTVLYNYALADTLTFRVRPTHDVKLVPTLAIPGLRTTVQSTDGIAVGNQALVTTYNKSGSEPAVGDFYYISYWYEKGDEAFEPQFFTNERDILSELGDATLDNPVSLAALLAYQNNTQIVGVVQVRRASAGADATLAEYQRALTALEEPLAGGLNANIICPITTDSAVQAACKSHVESLSSPVYAQERRAIFGTALGTSISQATDLAVGFRSARCQLVYSGGGGLIIRIPDALGRDLEFPADGSFVAAAYAGLDSSPRFDVAEPMTRKAISGFIRALGRIDKVQANLAARQGVTIIDDLEPTQRVRWAVTTDPRSVLTREANIQKIDDYVHFLQRQELDRFIGTKNLPARLGEIEEVLAALFKGLQNSNIIAGYKKPRARIDEREATGIIVEVEYAPVVPLNFITVRNFLSLDEF